MGLTRITKIRGFKNVLYGRDFNEIFKEGHVYGVTEIMGEIIFKDLGTHAEMEKHLYQSLETIMVDGSICLTKEEKNELQNNH